VPLHEAVTPTFPLRVDTSLETNKRQSVRRNPVRGAQSGQAPPVAVIGGTVSGSPGAALTFDGSRLVGPGAARSWVCWDFGDNVTANGVTRATRTAHSSCGHIHLDVDGDWTNRGLTGERHAGREDQPVRCLEERGRAVELASGRQPDEDGCDRLGNA